MSSAYCYKAVYYQSFIERDKNNNFIIEFQRPIDPNKFKNSLKEMGYWKDERESNFLDGASHFYNTYECSDNKYLAVGAIESKFYSILLTLNYPDFF